MHNAICLRCGAQKIAALAKCDSCGFEPAGDVESLVKSVYLSTGRYNEVDSATKYQSLLVKYSDLIKSGIPIEFEQSELDRLELQMKAVDSVSWYLPWIAVLEFLIKTALKSAFFFGIIFLIIRAIRSS
jgi:hypothetical protein